MKLRIKLICIVFSMLFFLYSPVLIYADESTDTLNASDLHAGYAALLDVDSGRVLFGKNADTAVPMASTTKIMTCVLALELGRDDLLCTTSSYAASMPDVQLNAVTGEQFYLKDLFYPLMLRSYNDTAVIIAENVALYYIYEVESNIIEDSAHVLDGIQLDFLEISDTYDSSCLANFSKEQSQALVSVFTSLMNLKAESLGCTQTHFVTPNGLDASDEGGTHSTTARELALIMAYCIQNQDFLDITASPNYSFSSYRLKNGEFSNFNSYSVTNANAFLNMYDNIISGKTGFTGNAGYCYVCAYRCDGRTFVVALLACGWPSNKTYKWQDSRLLLNWARQNFFMTDIITQDFSLKPVNITDGFSDSTDVYIDGTYSLLLSKNDVVNVVMNIPQSISAPVNSGDEVGNVCVYVNDELMYSTPVYAGSSVKQLDFMYFLRKTIKIFMLIDK